MVKFWDAQLVHTSIVEILLKEGDMTDSRLLKYLKESHKDLNARHLNTILFRLEIDGIVYVSHLTKNKRRVELRKI